MLSVAHLNFIPVNIPYTRPEVSSQVNRSGVTGVLVRAVTSDGTVGWGESCSGADTESVLASLEAMRPFIEGEDAWCAETLRRRLFREGLWNFRVGTANFSFAGIEMALLDACSRSVGLPLNQLLGGAVHEQVDYFYYLGREDESQLRLECRAGLSSGFRTFYMKVGIDEAEDLRLASVAVEELGNNARLRVDANAAWTLPIARRLMTRLEAIGVELCEQPVSESPPELMKDLRMRTSMWLSANEGLWSEADAYARILARQADVYCFSPYWVGSFRVFQALARVAEWEGSLVCKHTHGETAVAAAAMQQLMLTIPNLISGNQQTSHLLAFDLASSGLPIVGGPAWPRDDRPGIGIEVDEDSVGRANDLYRSEGQYMPYGGVAGARGARIRHA